MNRVFSRRLYICWLFCVMLGAVPHDAPSQQFSERFTAVAAFSRSKVMPMPLLRLSLNGKATGTFAFDSGTNTTLLTEGLSTLLGLKFEPILDATGHPRFFEGKPKLRVNMERLQFGTEILSDVPFILMDDNHFSGLIKEHVDGVLGATVLEACAGLFDFSKDEITLWYPGGLTIEERRKIGMEDSVALPMMYNNQGSGFTIAATLLQSGKRQEKVKGEEMLLIDTGQAITHISLAMAHRLKLKNIRKNLFDVTFGGDRKVEEGTVDTMILGGIEFHNLRVRYPNPTYKNYTPGLGLDVLAKAKFLFDWSNKIFYFKQLSPDAHTAYSDATQIGQAKP